MRVSITLLFLVCVGSIALTLSAAETVEGHMKAMEADVAALKTIHRQVIAQVKPPPNGALTVNLKLNGVIGWRDRRGGRNTTDLALTIYWSGGKPLVSPATADGWTGTRHYTDASKLAVTPTSVKGVVRVLLAAGTRSQDISVTLDASINSGAVTGTYRVAGKGGSIARAKGAISGTARKETAAARLPSKPKEDPLASIESYRYQTAQWLDRLSAALYQDIRAATMARSHGIALAHARRMVRTFPASYPKLPKLTKSGKVENKSAPKLDDSADDIMGLGLDDDEEEDIPVVRKKKKGKKGKAGKTSGGGENKLGASLLAYLGPIRERSSRRRLFAGFAANGVQKTAVAGDLDPGDPHFGPWYGEGPLPSKGRQENIVPASAGSAGMQDWPWVAGWLCLGTFPVDSGLLDTPCLPEFISSPGGEYPVDRRWKGGKNSKAPDVFRAGPSEIEDGTGLVRAPWQKSFEDHGHKRVNYDLAQTYHTAEVLAEKACELWAGITVDNHGKLWVNGRLAWRSPRDKNPWERQTTHIFKIALKQGANRLVARCDNETGDSCFCLRICTRGKPRPPAAAKAAVASFNEAHRRLGVPTKGTWGWRYDFTGRYPDCNPPLTWDPYKGINVRWRRPYKAGNSTPVIIGDKVITTEEPDYLHCLNKKTGETIWTTHVDIILTKSKTIQAEAAKVKKAADEARAALLKLGCGRHEQIAALQKQGIDRTAAQNKQKQMARAAGAYHAFQRKKVNWKDPGWGDSIGSAYATPITDGKHIWAKFSSGVLACLDLDGKIKWIVDAKASTDSWSTINSPLLIDGKLIFHANHEDKAGKSTRNSTPGKMHGLLVRAHDAATGKRLWITPTYFAGVFSGTVMPLSLTNGKEKMNVVVTPNGAVVRVSDGKLLRSFVGQIEEYGSPISNDANVVIISYKGSKTAYELIMLDRDTVGVKTLWFRNHLGYGQCGNYGLLLDGKLWYSRPDLDLTDMTTGRLEGAWGNLYFTKRPGRGYEPIALAGGALWIGDNATWFQPTYRPGLTKFPGACSAILPGNPPLPLGRNQIERTHGGFAFDEEAIYVRSKYSLMCFAYTGQEGRIYEAEKVAEELMSNVFPGVPTLDKPTEITGTVPVGAKEKPKVSAGVGGYIYSWLFAGPLPASAAADAIEKFSDPAWAGYRKDGVEVSLGGKTVFPKKFDWANASSWLVDGPFEILKRERFSKGPHTGWNNLLGDQVDLWRIVKPGPGKVAVLATLIHSESPRVARLDTSHPQVSVWIGGKPVKHGQAVKLPTGYVPFVVVAKLDEPAENAAKAVAPRLWSASADQKELDRWKAHMRRCKPYLERAARLSPDNRIGRRAAEALATL